MPGEAPTRTAPPAPTLRRELSGRQVGMIAVGGAVGTGLFLGSGLAISLAGPAVVVAYLVAALAALVVAYALAEMTAVHPEVGGFGALDYFKVREIFRAAEPAKEALKTKLSQKLAALS